MPMVGHGEGNGFEDDAFAALALPEGGEHARIILVGGEHLVAGFEVDAVLRDFRAIRWSCG